VQLEIGDYLIRDFVPEDAPAIARYANNPKIWINLRDGFPHPYTLRDAEDFLERVSSDDPRNIFAIASETEAIGAIGLMPRQDVHRFSAEMGYWLAEPFWGRGIATRAIIAVTQYAFEARNLHRIYAEPYAPNRASCRALEKAGFALEGIMRANVVKDGRILDQFLYARVKPGLSYSPFE
jgi:ribosomal-protein-alanine N-acetyltransferase